LQHVDIALIEEAFARLQQRVAEFAVPSMACLPRVKPYRTDIEGDYDHLSRVREWSLSGWDEEDE
jgi:hypothetical protein